MTPAQLSTIHTAAFTHSRGWSADEFAALLGSAHCTLICEPDGFALVRTVAGEAELLTIAVSPGRQGQGAGRKLMHRWLEATPADEAFLEVGADNTAAIALYASCGFAQVARRAAYYPRANGPDVDAIVMRRPLP